MNRGPLAALLLLTLVPSAAVDAQRSGEVTAHSEISKADFFVEGLAPVRKSGSYDVTIVYFMDYQCPACRQYTPDVARALKEDRRVRVIYRDTPLLGPRSDDAARAAIASHFQGRHETFHHALMMTKGPLDESAIRAAADKAGVDWSRLQRDIALRRDDIDMVITRNLELASATGIEGTPAFIVGESQSNGALDYNLLKAEIADARKAMANDTPPSNPKVDDPIDPNHAAIERPRVDEDMVQAHRPSNNPIFRPAKPIGEERLVGSNGSLGNDGLWMWLVTAVFALVGTAAVWKRASARSRSRSSSNAKEA